MRLQPLGHLTHAASPLRPSAEGAQYIIAPIVTSGHGVFYADAQERPVLTLAQIEAFCLSLQGVTVTVQWGDDHVYKVGGKMFAVAGGRTLGLSFKASDMAFELLPEQGIARPAPYLARAKWLQLVDAEALNAAELVSFLGEAHALVAARLTRKARAELGLAWAHPDTGVKAGGARA